MRKYLISAALAVSLLSLGGCQLTENLKFQQKAAEMEANPQTKVSARKYYQERLKSNTYLQEALKGSKSKRIAKLSALDDSQALYELYTLTKDTKYLEQATESFNYLALKEQVKRATKQGNLDEAAQHNLTLAIKNDLEAMYETGCNYLYGKNLPQNEAEGLSWLEKVAMVDFERYECLKEERNSAKNTIYKANQLLVYVYSGSELGKDLKNTTKFDYFIKLGAKRNIPDLQLILAAVYFHKDKDKYEQEITDLLTTVLNNKSYSQLHVEASYWYAMQLLYKDNKKATQKIARYANKALKSGKSEANFPLAMTYMYNGQRTKAKTLLNKIVDQDTTGESSYVLGYIYLKEGNITKAHSLLNKSADLDFPLANVLLIKLASSREDAEYYAKQACYDNAIPCELNMDNNLKLQQMERMWAPFEI